MKYTEQQLKDLVKLAMDVSASASEDLDTGLEDGTYEEDSPAIRGLENALKPFEYLLEEPKEKPKVSNLTVYYTIRHETCSQHCYIAAENQAQAIEIAESVEIEGWRENQDIDSSFSVAHSIEKLEKFYSTIHLPDGKVVDGKEFECLKNLENPA